MNLAAPILKGIGRFAADLLVPPVCLACQVRLDSRDALCGACWMSISFIRRPLCDRLGIPLPFGTGDGPLVSAAASADPPFWGRARAVAIYETGGVMSRLIHAMKYADRHDARRLFARLLADAGHELLPDCDVIVPVPLTYRRLVRRQFNQSALLARELSLLSGIPWASHLLVKARDTPPQVSLSGNARRENLRGAFEVPEGARPAVADRRILLLDDVLTTGATAEAATRALLRGGARAVDVLTLARVTTPTHALP
jgi:ComF family protein